MKRLFSREYQPTHLLNPAKVYTHSSQTDIRQTFERIKAEQNKQQGKVRRIR